MSLAALEAQADTRRLPRAAAPRGAARADSSRHDADGRRRHDHGGPASRPRRSRPSRSATCIFSRSRFSAWACCSRSIRSSRRRSARATSSRCAAACSAGSCCRSCSACRSRSVLLTVRPVLELVGQPPEVIPDAAGYVYRNALSVWPFYVFVVLRQTLQAHHRVLPIGIDGHRRERRQRARSTTRGSSATSVSRRWA